MHWIIITKSAKTSQRLNNENLVHLLKIRKVILATTSHYIFQRLTITNNQGGYQRAGQELENQKSGHAGIIGGIFCFCELNTRTGRHSVSPLCKRKCRLFDQLTGNAAQYTAWLPNWWKPQSHAGIQCGFKWNGHEDYWDDAPSKLQKHADDYPARGGRYTTEFTLSKSDINASESITRVIDLPRLKLAVAAFSPVDIILTDPDGLTTNKQVYGIPESYYYEDDFNEDGDLDDVVTLSELKAGYYLILLLPQPEANLTDVFTLEVFGEDTTVSFAYEVQVAHIPSQPYILRVTETGIFPIIPATVDFDSDTLNLNSEGNYVTTYIELPAGHGYDPNMINLGTITLNGQIQAEAKPTEIGDYDSDGIPDLMVKFNRSEVQKILQTGEVIKITISGNLTDGRLFEGTDFIRVKT